MKKVYWRPRAVSRPALLLIAMISIAGLMLVERWKIESEQPYADEKRAAALLARDAFAVIKAARLDVGPPIDLSVDPTGSGLIGQPMSMVTTVSGEVTAKQTSINPNFAAVILEMLKEAGVEEGDVVAVGMSGSFPALNICTYAACESLKARPLVISSASASQWGANVPALLWPRMEQLLREPRVDEDGKELPPVFTTKSIACSIGGDQDRGLGLSDEGLALVKKVIASCGLEAFRAEQAIPITAENPLVDWKADFIDNINERMELYKQEANGQPIKAYINVGGGTVSVGHDVGKRMFHPGLNERPPRNIREVDGVMPRMSKERVPVIHLVHIRGLARRYTMPLEPIGMPGIGEGGAFLGIDYSKPLVIGVLVFILASLYGFIRSDVGFRIMRASQSRKKDTQPEPMV